MGLRGLRVLKKNICKAFLFIFLAFYEHSGKKYLTEKAFQKQVLKICLAAATITRPKLLSIILYCIY